MRKWIIHSLLAVMLGTTVFAKALHVGEGFSYSSVRSALEAAKNTDTIFVHKGRYAEGPLWIQKQVVLIGVDWPVMDGLATSEIWRIEASYVTVRGFVFVRAGISYTQENAAVKVNDARFVTIEDNRFEKNFFSIYLAKSSFCVVRNNFISSDGKTESSSGNGIHLWYCRAITIENNAINGHRDGIYFEFVKSSIIRNNHSLGNLRYGLHFMFSDSCTYTGNTFEENSAGVAVMYTRYIAMYGNTFRRNWGPASYGILLKDITDSDIRDNVFENNTAGVHMEGSNRMTMRRNRFVHNGWALRLLGNCTDNFFTENDFENNAFDVATNSRSNRNTFSMNYWSNYSGYDLDRDGVGDEPYRPVSLFSVISEQHTEAMILMRSLTIVALDLVERIIPSLTPAALMDDKPKMGRCL